LELELAFALAYAALLHEQAVNVQQIALQKAEFLNIMRCSLRRNFSKRAFWVDVFVQRSRTSRKAGLPPRDGVPRLRQPFLLQGLDWQAPKQQPLLSS